MEINGKKFRLLFVDIETEWNLKNTAENATAYRWWGRYRNRVEFKVISIDFQKMLTDCRYRNRVEFKVYNSSSFDNSPWVDIETEWNLKTHSADGKNTYYRVDIETEWNLKAVACNAACIAAMRRYRNRVEFKGKDRGQGRKGDGVDIETEWNLKLHQLIEKVYSYYVDIETEWNLKKSVLDRDQYGHWVDIETEWNLKSCTCLVLVFAVL